MPPPADRHRSSPPPDDAPPDDAAALLGVSARLFRPAALARRLQGRGQTGPPVRPPLVRPRRTDLVLAFLTVAALAAGWLAADPARLAPLVRLVAALGADGG